MFIQMFQRQFTFASFGGTFQASLFPDGLLFLWLGFFSFLLLFNVL